MAQSESSTIVILTVTPEHALEIESLLAAEVTNVIFTRPPSLEKAVEILKISKPDLVIVEAKLNDSTATDLLKAVPRDQRSYPIFVISPDRSEEQFQKMFEEGADDFMLEPLDSLVLQSKVRSLLSQHYMSPLGFLGKREPLAEFRIFSDVQITSLSEEQAVLSAHFPIARGTIIRLDLLNGIVLQLNIQSTERAENSPLLFQVRASIEGLSEESARRLRQFLLKTAESKIS